MSKNTVQASLRVIDYDAAGGPRPDDLAKLSVPLTSMVTTELDEAQRYLGVRTHEILLAALARTFARTIGTGELSIDVTGYGSSLPLTCSTPRQTSATWALRTVHGALASATHRESATSDVLFSFVDVVPEAGYWQTLPSAGHALDLRVYRSADRLQMDWWYDTRRFEPYTVEEFTEQFPLALIELTSEAIPPIYGASEITATTDKFALAES